MTTVDSQTQDRVQDRVTVSGAPTLTAGAASGNDFVRLEAARRLGSPSQESLPVAAALALLKTLVADPNDYVRQAAKASVYAVARSHQDLDAARLGLAAARDANLHLRATIWQGLRSLPRSLITAAYTPPAPLPGYEVDCLDRCHVPVADSPLKCRVCIALLATPGFETLMDMCLTSLEKNAGLEGLDVTYVAFMPGADDACRAVCRRHGTVCVEPLPLIPPHASMKGVIYSLHRWVDADCYLSIEPDMLVLDSLRDIVDTVLADREGHLYAVPSFTSLWERNRVVREGRRWEPDAQGLITTYFAGDGDDVRFLIGGRPLRMDTFCNAGLFLGSREALRRVEAQILSMRPFASLWIDATHIYWRDEMVWNVAYSLAGNIKPLPKAYNFEPAGLGGDGRLYDVDRDESVFMEGDEYPPRLLPRHARIFHFIGDQKEQMPLYMRAYGLSG